MKTLGVIGGMGPEATAYYYSEVVKHTQATRDQEHIDTIILSHASIPDRTYSIITGDDQLEVSMLQKDAKTLEQLGVSNIAVPCNTSHYFYDRVQEVVQIPIIHMIRECVNHAIHSHKQVKRIGILGTNGTIQSGIYHRECDKVGIEAVAPSTERQQDIMSLIYDDIKYGLPPDVVKFTRAYDEMIRMHCDVVILACTELSVFKRDHNLSQSVIDAMDVLVYESIVRSGAVYKQ